MKTKICGYCHKELPTSEFGVCNTRKDGLQPWCNSCRKEYNSKYYLLNKEKINTSHNKHYYENKEQYSERSKEYRKKHKNDIAYRKKASREQTLNAAYSLKTPCVKCGEKRPWVIQFHHIDPSTKSINISEGKTKEELLNELSKCVCLCSNCHDEFHYFFGVNPKNPAEALKKYLTEGIEIEQTVSRFYSDK